MVQFQNNSTQENQLQNLLAKVQAMKQPQPPTHNAHW
jgi:hypothetical protein